jgi:hypothetical protein
VRLLEQLQLLEVQVEREVQEVQVGQVGRYLLEQPMPAQE